MLGVAPSQLISLGRLMDMADAAELRPLDGITMRVARPVVATQDHLSSSGRRVAKDVLPAPGPPPRRGGAPVGGEPRRRQAIASASRSTCAGSGSHGNRTSSSQPASEKAWTYCLTVPASLAALPATMPAYSPRKA